MAGFDARRRGGTGVGRHAGGEQGAPGAARDLRVEGVRTAEIGEDGVNGHGAVAVEAHPVDAPAIAREVAHELAPDDEPADDEIAAGLGDRDLVAVEVVAGWRGGDLETLAASPCQGVDQDAHDLALLHRSHQLLAFVGDEQAARRAARSGRGVARTELAGPRGTELERKGGAEVGEGLRDRAELGLDDGAATRAGETPLLCRPMDRQRQFERRRAGDEQNTSTRPVQSERKVETKVWMSDRVTVRDHATPMRRSELASSPATATSIQRMSAAGSLVAPSQAFAMSGSTLTGKVARANSVAGRT